MNTFGAENQKTTAANLVINEIDYDQPGADRAEYIEIKNNDSITVNLYTYEIELVRQNGTDYGSFAMPQLHIGPGDYFVACSGADADTVPNCDLQFGSSIQNGSTGPNAVALWFGTVITPVDTVSYEGVTVDPYTEDENMLNLGAPEDDDAGQDGISRIPDGADSNSNNEDFSQRCLTPGFANTTQTTNCESVFEPSIVLTLTAVPVSVTEPGANVDFDVQIENTGQVSVTITSLSEDVIGNLDGLGNCSLPIVVDPDQTASCQYTTMISGSGGQQITRSVSAIGVDKDDVEANASDNAVINISTNGGNSRG